ncbi:hypothetical protein, partial [Arthrobacter sp.]|uniref:hypothetical protein n=1 Tax=Arthrobacter sp. TaxID=1667 RepID=UPI002582B0B8
MVSPAKTGASSGTARTTSDWAHVPAHRGRANAAAGLDAQGDGGQGKQHPLDERFAGAAIRAQVPADG